MSEEEQEKIYELLFKDTKNKLEATIEKQQKEIERLQKKNKRYEKYLKDKDKKHEEILEYLETEKENDYISKDKILDILGYKEDDEQRKNMTTEKILSLIETIFEECDRLEDIEDRKVQVGIKNIENRRDKYWKDKIKEKFKKVKEECEIELVYKIIDLLEKELLNK